MLGNATFAGMALVRIVERLTKSFGCANNPWRKAL